MYHIIKWGFLHIQKSKLIKWGFSHIQMYYFSIFQDMADRLILYSQHSRTPPGLSQHLYCYYHFILYYIIIILIYYKYIV